ncbi:MAG: GNAT family N-acetyltransferase [Candidatus Riflebacteria bacterium]|nr:GNAT family N-acetyltransferase [Candidatus Riflebacteria bacterium]
MTPPFSDTVHIRELYASDREPIREIVKATGFFSPEEVDVAIELVDEALEKPDQQDYFFGVAVCPDGGSKSSVSGYVCFGERPLTEGTYDLYWIVVNPDAQRGGVGRALMRWAERRIHERGGRIVLAETSGKPEYDSTREFYKRIGYREEARLVDFYRPGDDLVMFTKHLGNAAIFV